MKHIKRWALMRNTWQEDIAQHSLQVSMIAHALALLRNRRFGGGADPERAALLALYHEAPEVITGDLATPIKYFNPGIRDAYKEIERMASEKLLDYLPADCQLLGGDLVETSGLGGYFPSGLVIGSVEEVQVDDSGASAYAIIKPSVDFDALTEVFIIKDFDIVT